MRKKDDAPKDMRRIRTGRRGEDLAAAYLQERGYRIVARNYRCLFGEADIIARDGETLVFVEVKSRKSETFGHPQEAVGIAKQKKLSRISLCYIQEKRLEICEARFDVIAVKLSPEGARIDLIPNAFDLAI
jgi:putative endonuclease